MRNTANTRPIPTLKAFNNNSARAIGRRARLATERRHMTIRRTNYRNPLGGYSYETNDERREYAGRRQGVDDSQGEKPIVLEIFIDRSKQKETGLTTDANGDEDNSTSSPHSIFH